MNAYKKVAVNNLGTDYLQPFKIGGRQDLPLKSQSNDHHIVHLFM